MNIIGLGTAGSQVANIFNDWPQYEVLCVDTEDKGYKNFFKVQKQATHEDYENSFTATDLVALEGPITFFVCGAGNISGLSLRLLEGLKSKDITIFYIKPDLDSLSKEAQTRHKITFGIMQQYARSNVFSKMYVVENKNVESILDNISITDYWKNINHAIANTYHMINYFDNTEPLLSTFSSLGKTSKIATFSVVNFDTLKEKCFYDLQKPRFKRYFFGVNKRTMQNEKDLLQKIREFVKEQTDENTHSSFSFYSTDYEHNYVYAEHCASMIQEENIS